MIAIYVLSFQGPQGGLTFPMNGVSTYWLAKLFQGTGIVELGQALAAKGVELVSTGGTSKALRENHVVKGNERRRSISLSRGSRLFRHQLLHVLFPRAFAAFALLLLRTCRGEVIRDSE